MHLVVCVGSISIPDSARECIIPLGITLHVKMSLSNWHKAALIFVKACGIVFNSNRSL